MNIHNNARLTPKGREILISRLERGEHPGDVAGAMGVSVRTVYKWRQRFRDDGVAGLKDRSSRPLSSSSRTPAHIEARVVALADLATQILQHRFDRAGRDIGADGVGEKRMQDLAVLVVHHSASGMAPVADG